MIAVLDVDELRSFALLASSAAEKMNETNGVVSTVVSKHDWKCPERTAVDESLERLKSNVNTLNEAFQVYSAKIIELANGYTEIINEQMRFNATYMDELARFVSEDDVIATVASGNNTSGVISDLESISTNVDNISSLHGASHGINIIDFEQYYNE